MVKDAPAAESHVMASPAAPFTEDAWAAALSHKTAVEAATMEAPAPLKEEVREVSLAQVQAKAQPEVPSSAPAIVAPPPEPEKPATASSWFSAVSSPWDAEVQKASRLASTWDTPATGTPAESAPSASVAAETSVYGGANEEFVKEDPAATVDALAPVLSDEAKAKVVEAALPAATVEAIREEAHQVAETVGQEAPAAATTAKTPEPSMEDMVAKVLAKMNPDMLQAVTRDILKNVVESMVRDEMNAKKQ